MEVGETSVPPGSRGQGHSEWPHPGGNAKGRFPLGFPAAFGGGWWEVVSARGDLTEPGVPYLVQLCLPPLS